MSLNTEDERICRYCFEGEEDGSLISPCKCSGGQKFVHMACLRRWQRGVLVSQPTHPAFYEDDVRHHRCNVCLSEYTCPPPSRGELMESFTGPELAALLEPGCVIASHDHFSSHLKTQMESIPDFLHDRLSYCHWIDGAYLITKVEADEGTMTIPLTSQRLLENVRRRLAEDLSITMRGRKLRVAAAGSLEGVAEDDLPEALAALTAPAEIVLEAVQRAGCSEDHIAAVNLTRPAPSPPVPGVVSAATDAVSFSSQVELRHFLGGPCGESDVACCVVLGGRGCGWTVVEDLQDAIKLAHARAAPRFKDQGSFASGQTVRLCGLKAASHLNGELGLTLSFDEKTGRWQVRLQNGEGKCVKPANLEASSAADEGPKSGRGMVMVFWGDAQWSRAQLLGEIARGSWGMCRAGVSELIVEPKERRRGLDGRLAFAPISEMSDDYIRDAQGQMELLRGQAQAQGAASSASRGAAADQGDADGGDGDVSSRPEAPSEPLSDDNDRGTGNEEETAACGEEEGQKDGSQNREADAHAEDAHAASAAADAGAHGSEETGISKAAGDEAPNSVESHPLGTVSDSDD